MIYTLTLNPAIDYVLSYEHKQEGLQKTKVAKYIPGGKGINASVILDNLKVKNKAIIQSDGLLGQKLERLLLETNVKYININAGAETRVNVKSNFAGKTVEMNADGNKVKSDIIISKIKMLINKMRSKDTLMVMGSLPIGFSFVQLEEIVKYAQKNKVKLAFDVSKNYLLKLAKYKPEIIKPNIHELEDIFKTKISTKTNAFKYAKKLVDKGAKRVVVSFGKDGLIYLDKDHSLSIAGIKIKEANGSGAGDSLIAAFVAGLEQKLDVKEILKLAAGAGTATAASQGIATKAKINSYKKLVKITGGKNV